MKIDKIGGQEYTHVKAINILHPSLLTSSSCLNMLTCFNLLENEPYNCVLRTIYTERLHVYMFVLLTPSTYLFI